MAQGIYKITEKIIGIYKITCAKTNKIYIGQSSNIKYRFSKYKSLSVKNQIKIYNSLKKYGYDNHTFEILEKFNFLDHKKLNEREQYYMDFYRKKGFILLNIKEAGNNGLHSNETKIKIGLSNSKKLKGRKLSESHINNIKKSLINNKRRLGSKTSSTTKKLMSNSHSGKIKNPIHCFNISESKKKKILQYTTSLILLNEFNCAEDAAKLNNLKFASNIRKCALGLHKSAYGYIWKYKN